MSRRPITEEISVQEMLALREEERLTNAEIGRRLEINPQTVQRYIGKTPKELLHEARSEATKRLNATMDYSKRTKKAPVAKEAKYSPPYDAKHWQESTTIHKLSGFYANYEVNSTAHEVEITFIDGHGMGKMNKADLMKLIDEFSRIANILEK